MLLEEIVKYVSFHSHTNNPSKVTESGLDLLIVSFRILVIFTKHELMSLLFFKKKDETQSNFVPTF